MAFEASNYRSDTSVMCSPCGTIAKTKNRARHPHTSYPHADLYPVGNILNAHAAYSTQMGTQMCPSGREPAAFSHSMSCRQIPKTCLLSHSKHADESSPDEMSSVDSTVCLWKQVNQVECRDRRPTFFHHVALENGTDTQDCTRQWEGVPGA